MNRSEELRRLVTRLDSAAKHRLRERLGLEAVGHAAEQDRQALVGYYTTHHGERAEGPELRRHLGRLLPEHMIPTVFCHLQELPRGRRGKVDKAALPWPFDDHREGAVSGESSAEDVAPTETEAALLDIWRAALGADQVGLHDSFFELGGDSLLGIRVLGQIRERWQVDLSMETLFDSPTVSGTASHLDAVLWARDAGQAAPSSDDDREEIEF